MRDGVRLATDIYLPTEKGEVIGEKLSTILRQTPYNKETAHKVTMYYATRGYAVVFQDTRGRYKSEGVWHMLNDNGRDGYECCEWIAVQPWSNGKLGMYGTSYEGGIQHAIVMEKSPYLKTSLPPIIPSCIQKGTNISHG